MHLTQKELSHVEFLAKVILDGNKKAIMPDLVRILLYILKGTKEVHFSEQLGEQFNLLVEQIEEQLRLENDRIQEIMQNLEQPAYQRKFRGRDF